MNTPKNEIVNTNMRNYGVLFTVCRAAMDTILAKRQITIDSKQLDTMIINRLVSISSKQRDKKS